MNRLLLPLSLLALSACTAEKIQADQAKVDAAIAKAQPSIEMVCWGIKAADAVFQSVVAPKLTPAQVADEAKAVAAANAICANPPQSSQDAVAIVIAAYKAVTAN